MMMIISQHVYSQDQLPVGKAGNYPTVLKNVNFQFFRLNLKMSSYNGKIADIRSVTFIII